MKVFNRFGPYFVGPIVAGLEKDGTPVIATYDSIGCMSASDPYQVGGTATENLMGAAETFYKKNMKPDELAEVAGQVLVSGMDRNILAGWGGLVYVL